MGAGSGSQPRGLAPSPGRPLGGTGRLPAGHRFPGRRSSPCCLQPGEPAEGAGGRDWRPRRLSAGDRLRASKTRPGGRLQSGQPAVRADAARQRPGSQLNWRSAPAILIWPRWQHSTSGTCSRNKATSRGDHRLPPGGLLRAPRCGPGRRSRARHHARQQGNVKEARAAYQRAIDSGHTDYAPKAPSASAGCWHAGKLIAISSAPGRSCKPRDCALLARFRHQPQRRGVETEQIRSAVVR